jgi:hypothetical protein
MLSGGVHHKQYRALVSPPKNVLSVVECTVLVVKVVVGTPSANWVLDLDHFGTRDQVVTVYPHASA